MLSFEGLMYRSVFLWVFAKTISNIAEFDTTKDLVPTIPAQILKRRSIREAVKSGKVSHTRVFSLINENCLLVPAGTLSR